jgi:hypothetical protein
MEGALPQLLLVAFLVLVNAAFAGETRGRRSKPGGAPLGVGQ